MTQLLAVDGDDTILHRTGPLILPGQQGQLQGPFIDLVEYAKKSGDSRRGELAAVFIASSEAQGPHLVMGLEVMMFDHQGIKPATFLRCDRPHRQMLQDVLLG